MSFAQLIRWSGLAGILGGISIAVFVLVHPWNQFVGAEVARTTAWRIAHSLHFVGATLTLLGLIGLYARQMQHLGQLGLIGFVLAFIGTAMFVGTGMLTAFIWPMVAVQAPDALGQDGAMFLPPAVVALVLTAVVVTLGYILFGLAMLRASVLPRWGIVLFVVGAVLGMGPPQPLGPLPWAGLVLGGVLFGIGGIWLGYALWTSTPEMTDRVPA
jgi:hypothetical protein